MKEDTENRPNKIFKDSKARKLFQTGIKYLAGSLLLLVASPILVTIGFKAINKGGGYWMLILGCLLTIFTIGIVTQAFRLILKSLFSR